MTPVPIYHEDKCRWGALDIDTYDLTDEEMNNIVIGASRENLIPTRTKSGGLHLWAFASEEVPARFMRAKLMKSRDTLQLSPKTEIFPKQEQLENRGQRQWNNNSIQRIFFIKRKQFKNSYGAC